MMKKISVLIFLFFVTIAAQPVIDGTFDGEVTWGTPKYTADGTAGWANANAKKVYVTNDASYIYVGAEITASNWMSWCFIFNTKIGGTSTDSWGRDITYTHSSLPDYAIRGNFNNGWSEINSWNGAAWTGNGTDITTSEHKDNISGADITGWVEARISRSTITELTGDIQFFITGDQTTHGSFDACPDDDNSFAWSGVDAHSNLVNYISNVPLPVELTSFSASIKNKSVNLVWHTATEVNNYGFEIQRSSANGSFAKVGFVNGSGNSNSAKEYTFTDKTATTGKYSYRLKQIDNDGQYKFSDAVEVNFSVPVKYNLAQNFPNPFNPTTTINYQLAQGEFVSLKVFNAIGTEVATLVNEYKDAGEYRAEFGKDLKNISSGIYFYTIRAGSFIQTRKMLLLK